MRAVPRRTWNERLASVTERVVSVISDSFLVACPARSSPAASSSSASSALTIWTSSARITTVLVSTAVSPVVQAPVTIASTTNRSAAIDGFRTSGAISGVLAIVAEKRVPVDEAGIRPAMVSPTQIRPVDRRSRRGCRPAWPLRTRPGPIDHSCMLTAHLATAPRVDFARCTVDHGTGRPTARTMGTMCPAWWAYRSTETATASSRLPTLPGSSAVKAILVEVCPSGTV